MNRSVRALLAGFGAVVIGISGHVAAAQARSVVFSDDFDGSVVDRAKWEVERGRDDKGTIWSPDAVRVGGGVLTISANERDVSGHLNIVPANVRKYGRWEVRMRSSVGGGFIPGAFLWPAPGAPMGREYDFAECVDPARRSCSAFVHIGDRPTLRKDVALDATQWHTYAMEWTPRGLAFFVDGRQWWQVDDRALAEVGPMGLMIELYRWRNNGPAKPTTMDVDWVRVYSP